MGYLHWRSSSYFFSQPHCPHGRFEPSTNPSIPPYCEYSRIFADGACLMGYGRVDTRRKSVFLTLADLTRNLLSLAPIPTACLAKALLRVLFGTKAKTELWVSALLKMAKFGALQSIFSCTVYSAAKLTFCEFSDGGISEH